MCVLFYFKAVVTFLISITFFIHFLEIVCSVLCVHFAPLDCIICSSIFYSHSFILSNILLNFFRFSIGFHIIVINSFLFLLYKHKNSDIKHDKCVLCHYFYIYLPILFLNFNLFFWINFI